jgi:hypothetical protein
MDTAKRDPRVYIVNKGGHDYSDSIRFGVPVFLSEGPMHRHAIGSMYRIFSERLADSEPYDYILASGLTQMTAVAVAIFVFMHGRVNFLLYDVDGSYVARDLVLSNLLGKGDAA